MTEVAGGRELSKEQLLQAYRTMKTIREFEERLHTEFATGEIPGFVHLYAGEEAIAAGFMAHLDENDYVASTPGARPLHRQGVRRQGDDAGDLRQG
jgi:acetoin:2,6-dichlorophenolindophenol oxidoreductase subunit alpha